MTLRLFADQCVPTSAIRALREAGHEVLRLADHIPVESPDEVVIRKANDLGAILISLNGDFADIVAYPPAKYAGIVAIQLHNRPQVLPEILKTLRAYLDARGDIPHYRGILLLVQAHRVRIRR